MASSTPKGVFVRFLGRLTGMATVSQLSDSFVSDPAGLFTQGQSVRAKVVEINEDLGRFTLTTKQSQCFSLDATYLKSFFAAEQKVRCCVTHYVWFPAPFFQGCATKCMEPFQEPARCAVEEVTSPVVSLEMTATSYSTSVLRG